MVRQALDAGEKASSPHDGSPPAATAEEDFVPQEIPANKIRR